MHFTESPESSFNFAWIPHIDWELIKEEPYALIHHKVYAKVPIITGNCDDIGIVNNLRAQNLNSWITSVPSLSSSTLLQFKAIFSPKDHDNFYSRQLQRLKTLGTTVYHASNQ
ncbi:hypothetical protein BDN71DRAFT_1433216 [Pleurotus eryngii]|uniref:Uncharacterized protein n=1 Tax=Pleurotus eryngii TaxID=5323 RepID=A0A9P5ZU78_PLEER|nr:hypothetical protein BDN71DRAFT_1433216 [Pleurotus eryngii]